MAYGTEKIQSMEQSGVKENSTENPLHFTPLIQDDTSTRKEPASSPEEANSSPNRETSKIM